MKKYEVPVYGYVRVRTLVRGVASIQASSPEEARLIAKQMAENKVSCIYTDTPKGIEISDDFEWHDTVDELLDNISHSDMEDVYILPEDLDDIQD